MVPRDYARIYDMLRKIGHTGTDEDIAQRIIAVARQATIPVDVVCHDYTCTEPHQRRAHGTCAIVGDIVRTGRSALILPDTAAACESDADCLRVYDLLRKVGHAGTEDEIAERMIAAAPRAGLRPDAIAEDYPCSAAFGSPEWRRNRAKIVSCIVGLTTKVGRTAVLMPDAEGVPCEPDGDGVAEDPDTDADADGPSDEDDIRRAISELVNAVKNCDLEAHIDAAESMLDDMDWAVGEAAAAVQPLQEDESEDVRLHAFHTLCHLGADAEAVVPTIIGHLRGENQLARCLAVNTLGNTQRYSSAAAVPYLIEVLTEPNSDAGNRVWATSALGFCGVDAEGAVPALARGLTDEDKWVRDRSAAALMNIGPAAKEALPALLKARRSEDSCVRVYAVGALLRLGPAAESGVPALIDGLMDGDVEERKNDADILGCIGPAAKEAVPALTAALNDESRRVRDVTKLALERIVADAPLSESPIVLVADQRPFPSRRR